MNGIYSCFLDFVFIHCIFLNLALGVLILTSYLWFDGKSLIAGACAKFLTSFTGANQIFVVALIISLGVLSVCLFARSIPIEKHNNPFVKWGHRTLVGAIAVAYASADINLLVYILLLQQIFANFFIRTFLSLSEQRDKNDMIQKSKNPNSSDDGTISTG